MKSVSLSSIPIVRQEPIDESRLDQRDNLEGCGTLSDGDLAHFRDQARRLASAKRAVVATFGGLAVGDIALVPAPFLKHPRGIRDITEWYIATANRKEYVHAILSGQCEIALFAYRAGSCPPSTSTLKARSIRF